MNWRALGIAVGCALAVPAVALAAIPGPGNLILNGDAEFGPFAHDVATVRPPIGWKTTGSFTVRLYQEPAAASASSVGAGAAQAIQGGKALFAGGPQGGTASATQTFPIPAPLLPSVAAGRAQATAAAGRASRTRRRSPSSG